MKQHVETSQISGTRGIEASKDKSPTIVTKEEVKEARAEALIAGAEEEEEAVERLHNTSSLLPRSCKTSAAVAKVSLLRHGEGCDEHPTVVARHLQEVPEQAQAFKDLNFFIIVFFFVIIILLFLGS